MFLSFHRNWQFFCFSIAWSISVIAHMDEFIHAPVNNHISSGKELSIIQTTPTLKYIYLLGAFIINSFREGGGGLVTKQCPCTNMVVTFIMFIVSRSNSTGTLWIHIRLREIIYDPQGLPDHVLIISQKLAIFLLFIFLEFIGYG